MGLTPPINHRQRRSLPPQNRGGHPPHLQRDPQRPLLPPPQPIHHLLPGHHPHRLPTLLGNLHGILHRLRLLRTPLTTQQTNWKLVRNLVVKAELVPHREEVLYQKIALFGGKLTTHRVRIADLEHTNFN